MRADADADEDEDEGEDEGDGEVEAMVARGKKSAAWLVLGSKENANI